MDVICPGFTQIERLGEGGFGVVYLAKRQSDDEVRLKRHRLDAPLNADAFRILWMASAALCCQGRESHCLSLRSAGFPPRGRLPFVSFPIQTWSDS